MNKTLWARPALGTSLLLSIPLVMTFIDRAKAPGDGWRWGPGDFLIMGALLFGAGFAFEVFSRKLTKPAHRWALGLGILAVVLVIWVQLAVQGVSQLIAWLFG